MRLPRLLLGTTLITLTYCQNSANLDPRKAWERYQGNEKNIVVLDVRTPAEYAQGHLEKAFLMNLYDQFEKKADQLDTSKTYYVYCHSGARSSQAVTILRRKGFKAYNIGSIESAIAAGFPKAKN
ncbi:MAG: rhodanese-like domain-containing protein [Bacteroidia bacterium]